MLDDNGKLINHEVRIENTNFCNGACTICPREKLTRPKVTMLFENFIDLVDQAKELGAKTIGVFGFGEPFCDDALEYKISYCRLMGLETFITTNGSLVTQRRSIESIIAGLTHIRFSVHGERIQGTELYRDAIRRIGHFITINKKMLHNCCKISITMIPMGTKNFHPLIQAWEKAVDWIEIWRPHNFTDGRDYRKLERKKKSCNRPFSGPVQINSDGTVMVCCFDFDGKLTIGDTKKESLQDILEGEKFNEIKRKHQDGNLEGLICETCDQLNQEKISPLLYSSRDPEKKLNTTSSIKFSLEE